jgi:hypothetical protein
LRLVNVATATLDGVRARLDGRKRLDITLDSDGTGRVRLVLPLPAGATVRLVSGGGPGWSAAVDTGGLTVTTGAGSAAYAVQP